MISGRQALASIDSTIQKLRGQIAETEERIGRYATRKLELQQQEIEQFRELSRLRLDVLAGDLLPKALFMEETHGFNLATIGIIMATVWQYSGYTMALYLAGFTGISQDLRDAAMLDGATTAQYYRHVALPMVKPITISAVIILSHISLKMFDLIFSMTGPDNAETGHPALNMYLTTFRANDFAKGAAIAIILFLIAATFIVPYLINSYRQRRVR